MKFSILKSDLSKYIGIAQRAISNKSAIQILEGIVFQAKDNELILSATDLELSVNTKVACNVEKEGSVVLNSEIIGNIVRKMPEDMITFNGDHDGIKITCQNSMFNLKGQDAMEYPDLPDPVNEVTFTMDAKDLKEAIKETIFATSSDETFMALTGVLFNQKNDQLEMVGLDGYRMALRKYSYQTNEMMNTIVPKRALNELSKIIENGDVDISIVKGHIIFSNENTKMYSRIIDKKYIDYEKIISKDNKTKVIINRDDLLNSLERSILLAKGGAISLSKFNIEDGVINIQSTSDFGDLNENVNCQKIGDDLVISFNTRYVLDGLKAIDDDQLVMYFNGSLNPMVIHPKNDEDNFLYLVLPVRMSQ